MHATVRPGGVRGPWARGLLVALSLAVGTAGVAGCGSSSSSSSLPSPASTTSASTTSASTSAPSSVPTPRSPRPAGVAVERALLDTTQSTPRVTAAACRPETTAQRGGSPFGRSGSPVYACSLARGGPRAAYDVQVLPSGCFVAERRRPGSAIYGCGVARR